MRAALRRADVDPKRVGYINAHGTSTPLGDLAETRAIKQVFGEYASELAVSSTKSVTGHCFGAAGAIEAMMCVLAVHHGVLPPTANYEHPDPECDLDYVPNESREAQVDVALRTRWASAGTTPALLGRFDASETTASVVRGPGPICHPETSAAALLARSTVLVSPGSIVPSERVRRSTSRRAARARDSVYDVRDELAVRPAEGERGRSSAASRGRALASPQLAAARSRPRS